MLNYKTAQKRIKVLESRVRELEDTCTVTLNVDRGTVLRILEDHREKVEGQMETIEVKCTKCGSTHRVQKGQLTQEGIEQYVCETCSEAVLERRVEDMENRKGGRQLLTD
jgi:predicted SprT family Zn-dependent metalloprotease